jgi:hypothetical protein
MLRCLLCLLLAGAAAFAEEDPCKLEFENDWVRVSRVTYPPFGKSKTKHNHPAIPTVYVYLNDSGPIRFKHDEGVVIERRAVKAGQIRFNRGMVETHEVESMSDTTSEYLRIEMKTEPLELPRRDVRIAADENTGFENAMFKIEKLVCSPNEKCAGANQPSVVVNLNDRKVTWVKDGSPALENSGSEPAKLIRVALKTAPRAP